ncbi:MAG: hypothetical protein BWY66_02504 [bacterium ADurb.Bin374]|nr:MAG: hypothetical protein BWY66_02504 [bacterium ADurb.Bin374]
MRDAARHAQLELELDIIGRKDEVAVSIFLVSPSPAGLLEIVFEGTWNLGVDHHPDVGLVDAHAESVRGAHHPETAGQELLLHTPLVVGGAARVKEVGLKPRCLKFLGEVFCRLAFCGEQDRATPVAEPLFQDLDGKPDLVVSVWVRVAAVLRVEPVDMEPQILPLGRADEQVHLLAGLLPEIGADLLDHVELRRGGEAGNRRQGGGFPEHLLQERAQEQVVGPEIVAPFRQAVRLVDDDKADLPLGKGVAERAVAHLFGGDPQDVDIAEGDFFVGLRPLEDGKQAVERPDVRDAAPREGVDLVFHQRLERRYDEGQQVSLPRLHQRGKLVTERLAAAGRQDDEAVPAFEDRFDDILLGNGRRPFENGPECVEGVKKPLERLEGGMILPAILACTARSAPKGMKDLDGPGKRMDHPRREPRHAVCHGKPGQRHRKGDPLRPAIASGVEKLFKGFTAGFSGKGLTRLAERLVKIQGLRPGFTGDGRGATACHVILAKQAQIQRQKRVDAELPELFPKQGKRRLGIAQRVVSARFGLLVAFP